MYSTSTGWPVKAENPARWLPPTVFSFSLPLPLTPPLPRKLTCLHRTHRSTSGARFTRTSRSTLLRTLLPLSLALLLVMGIGMASAKVTIDASDVDDLEVMTTLGQSRSQQYAEIHAVNKTRKSLLTYSAAGH